MKIYVDIDETICYYYNNDHRHYPEAIPNLKNIEKINKLFNEGHEITYWTARGTVTGQDWYDITEKQLLSWGCKYNALSVGEKPNYDLLICDKAINSNTFFQQEDTMTFREYYEYYLSLHQNKWCRRMHFMGQCFTIIYTATILYNWFWYLLFTVPFVIYPFAWSGHYFFEKNKPAAFSRPVWAKACDWIMFKDIITGRVKI